MKYCILFTLLVGSNLSCDNPQRTNFISLEDGKMLNSIDSMIYVWIPPGKIVVNESVEANGEKKLAQKEINLNKGFWMSKTEVTVRQFRTFVSQTGYITEAEKTGNKFNWRDPGFEQKPNHPVVYISIEDIKQYLLWSNNSLPTQEEWIYATKANATTNYYWGDDFDENYLWYRMNAPTGTKPVGTKLPNNWGLHDMIGNVHEYVSVCDTSYFAMGSSWSRCNDYSSHIQGELVHLNVGNIQYMKLMDCSILPRNQWNDDTGFRCVIKIE